LSLVKKKLIKKSIVQQICALNGTNLFSCYCFT